MQYTYGKVQDKSKMRHEYHVQDSGHKGVSISSYYWFSHVCDTLYMYNIAPKRKKYFLKVFFALWSYTL